jgi:hypothetical protein
MGRVVTDSDQDKSKTFISIYVMIGNITSEICYMNFNNNKLLSIVADAMGNN